MSCSELILKRFHEHLLVRMNHLNDQLIKVDEIFLQKFEGTLTNVELTNGSYLSVLTRKKINGLALNNNTKF